MKLYHNPISPNARRVLLTAAHLGIPLEEKVLNVAKGEHKTPEYLALNPNGMIPTLVDGDLKLWESRGIIQYLASKKPGNGLLGKDETARADVTRWLCWDAGHLAPNVGTLIFENVLKAMLNMGPPDQSAVKNAAEQVKRFCGVIDTSLKGKWYLVGESLTLADLSVAATFTYAGPLNLPVNDFPSLKAWFSRITALDAWKKTQPKM